MPASPGEIAPRRFGLPHPRHFFALSAERIDSPRGGAAVFENNSGSHRRRARQHVARRRVRRLSRGVSREPRAPPGAGRALSAAARLRLGQFYGERRRRAALGAPAGARVDSRGARRLRHRGRVRRVHREAFRDDARSGGARHRRVVPRLARPGTVDPAVAVPDPAARPQFQPRRRGPRRVHAGIPAARSAAAPGGAFDGRRDRAGLPAPPSRICSPARRCPRRWSGCASDACRRRWCAS